MEVSCGRRLTIRKKIRRIFFFLQGEGAFASGVKGHMYRACRRNLPEDVARHGPGVSPLSYLPSLSPAAPLVGMAYLLYKRVYYRINIATKAAVFFVRTWTACCSHRAPPFLPEPPPPPPPVPPPGF